MRRPVVVLAVQQCADAKTVSRGTVVSVVVDEKGIAGLDTSLGQHGLEYVSMGLDHVHLIGEEDTVEEVAQRMAVITHEMVGAVVPVHVVGVAEQEDAVVLVQLQYLLLLAVGYVREQAGSMRQRCRCRWR